MVNLSSHSCGRFATYLQTVLEVKEESALGWCFEIQQHTELLKQDIALNTPADLSKFDRPELIIIEALGVTEDVADTWTDEQIIDNVKKAIDILKAQYVDTLPTFDAHTTFNSVFEPAMAAAQQQFTDNMTQINLEILASFNRK